jgi:DnaD/phage-associated family protein
MYAEFATDPKVQSMSEIMQRRLTMLFCLQCNGDLSKITNDELCAALRINKKELDKTKDLFFAKGFISETFQIVNWDKRQFVSDNSTDRVKKFRDRCRNANETFQKQSDEVSETPPEAEADTDTDLELSSSTSTTRTREEVCKLFQQEIGVMSPSMRDKVHSAIDDYSPDWTYYAIERAVLQGKRSMAYILAVLSGWKTDGFDTGQTPWEEKRRHAQSGGTTVATTSSGTPTPEQAWREVSQNLDPCKMPKWSHDKIANAVKAVGYPLLYGPSELSVKKAAFIKAYGGG